jgi:chromosome segregation ATPase
MSDNLVLERLREIRTTLGEVKEDTADLRLRFGLLEAGYASLSLRVDRLASEVGQIKRRLDLADAPA